MLELIAAKLGTLVPSTWVDDVTTWGALVRLYREYDEGTHRAKLTTEMKEMLRISDARTDQFTINYCKMVVQTMADRLNVTAIDGDNDAAKKWSAEVLNFNRFDGLQPDMYDAAIRDGVTYAMITFDNDAQQPIIKHELAWDGEEGMIAIYDRTRTTIVAAVKIWLEGDDKRVNIYWPNRVERFKVEGAQGDKLESLDPEPVVWVDDVTKAAVGVPVIAFQNQAKSRSTVGMSELAPVIPMQDALNRTLVSMVMTAELTAFQLRVAIGFPPPSKVTPGMWIVIGENEPPSKDVQVDAKVMEQGQIAPFLNQALFLIDQIGTVSRTPLPDKMGGDNASGEAIKQREIGLLGKVKRFKVKGGNSWEDVMAMAARVQQAFGTKKPPASKRWDTKWENSEIRNDAEVIDNALKLEKIVGIEEVLRMIAPIFGYDEKKIKELLAEREAQQAKAMEAMGGNVPDFRNFGNGVETNPTPAPAATPAPVPEAAAAVA